MPLALGAAALADNLQHHCRRVGVETAALYLAKLRGKRRKAYADSSADQQQQDRAWLLGAAHGDIRTLCQMTADIVNQHQWAVAVLVECLEDNVLERFREFVEKKLPYLQQVRQEKRELDLDLTLSLFLETDMSWQSYATFTHMFRVHSEVSDLRLPSKNQLHERCVPLLATAMCVSIVIFVERSAFCTFAFGMCRLQRLPTHVSCCRVAVWRSATATMQQNAGTHSARLPVSTRRWRWRAKRLGVL